MNNNLDGLYELPPPEHARGFFDPIKTRNWLFDYAKDGYQQKLNKIESKNYKLRLKNIDFDKDKHFSYKDQNDAILQKKDLTVPLKATVEMIHKPTNTVVDTKNVTIANLPYITDRNTVIYNGSEYITTNQQRLKPGMYSRVKETGELETHVSPLAGTGLGGKLIFYPESAIFVYQVGTAEIKLYGLLHDLGVLDQEMKEAWGEEIFNKNKATYRSDEIDKLYKKIFIR